MERPLEELWKDEGLEQKYGFEERVASSTMAIVVAARHLELDERVAIKFLSPDAIRSQTAVARFRSEAKAAAKIKSQHVVRIIDVSTTSRNVPYIVMEFLDGKDLDRLLADYGERRTPITDAVDFILQASEAVAEGHALGIVHRDLKPANLFCVDRGDGYPLIKVLDFGISKVAPRLGNMDQTNRNEILGSPRYMSPEQIESAADVDLRSDIWALGVILYEAIAGHPPFNDERIIGLWNKIRHIPAVPLPELRPECPAELWTVVNRCLAKDPALRYAHLGELAKALAPFAPDRSRACIARILFTSSTNDTSSPRTSPFSDSFDRVMTQRDYGRLRPVLVIGALFVLMAGLLHLILNQRHTGATSSHSTVALPTPATEAAAVATLSASVSPELHPLLPPYTPTTDAVFSMRSAAPQMPQRRAATANSHEARPIPAPRASAAPLRVAAPQSATTGSMAHSGRGSAVDFSWPMAPVTERR